MVRDASDGWGRREGGGYYFQKQEEGALRPRRVEKKKHPEFLNANERTNGESGSGGGTWQENALGKGEGVPAEGGRQIVFRQVVKVLS